MKIGFFGLLQVIFIVLKIIGQIDWSWWLVFVPFYIWFVLYILAMIYIDWRDRTDPMWRFRK